MFPVLRIKVCGQLLSKEKYGSVCGLGFYFVLILIYFLLWERSLETRKTVNLILKCFN